MIHLTSKTKTKSKSSDFQNSGWGTPQQENL